MRGATHTLRALLDNPVLVGTLTLLVAIVAVYVSYGAENGLPFVPSYQISVEVPNGDELGKGDDVRVGGALVGQVQSVVPEPARPRTSAPYARVSLRLDHDLEPLSANTRVRIEMQSVLGDKYLALTPGHGRAALPDGGTLGLSQAQPSVDLDQFLGTFTPATRAHIRSSVDSLSDALAGRGTANNASLVNLAQLLGPLQLVLATISDPSTGLSSFIDGLSQTTEALAPVSSRLTHLLGAGAVTLGGLADNGRALGQVLQQLPSTESSVTGALAGSQPVLADAQRLLVALGPAAPRLRPAAAALDGIVRSATPIFRQEPSLVSDLHGLFGTLDHTATDPDAIPAIKILGNNDLPTFATSGFIGLGAILKAAQTAQLNCNLAVPWLVNFASAISEGDATGPWLRTTLIYDPKQISESATKAADLHANPYPIEDATECAGGNEPYTPGQLVGNPPGLHSKAYQQTSQPAGVAARAAAAGLEPAAP